MANKVKVLETMEEYTQALADAKDALVVIDFHATWCGPCKMIAPFIVKLADEFTNVLFYKVDVDEAEEIAVKNDVSAMPTFKFFKNGKSVDELMGANQEKLRALVEKHK